MITAAHRGKMHEIEYSIVNVSELEGELRIDAEYYEPFYLRNEEIIKRKMWDVLGSIFKKICSGKTPTSYNENGKNLVVRSGDLTGNIINKGSLLKTDEEKLFWLEEKDILISSIGKGSIGKVAINLEKERLATVSEVTVLRDCKYNPFFIAIYLQSKFGQTEINRQITGATGQLHLLPSNIASIIAPKTTDSAQEKIEEMVLKAYEEREKADSLYKIAEDTLLEELGLKDWRPKSKKIVIGGKEFEEEENISIRNLSEAIEADRIDAEYFQPAYEEISKKIKEYPNGFSRLLNHVENVNPNFDPTKYPEQTFSYVELADIDSSIGVIHRVNELKGEEAPSRARRMLKEGDVIVSSVEGSLEKVALVDKEHNGCLASTGFFQFRPLDILSEVLLVLSKTIVLQSQLKKKCSGTILTAVPKESLRDIIIPILPLSTQQKIASLVQQSHEARKRAKELIEIAKRAVEIAIEEEEQEALSYISKYEFNLDFD